MAGALARDPLPLGRLWLAALGKAAGPMARAAVAALAAAGREPAGGLLVAPAVEPVPHPALASVAGDHPVPGAGSLAAAGRLGALAARVGPDDVLLVLLSGGASALVAAPAPGVSADELAALSDRLLRSGADIGAMNALRRRFARWGAGRLAAAVAPATVRCLAVSDVAGDDPAVIGSGPCAPDPLTAADLLALADAPPLAGALSPALRSWLEGAARGERPETPKPGDRALAGAATTIVLANRDALDAAAAAAERCAVRGARIARVVRVGAELAGEAADAGRACAERLLAEAGPAVVLWGGEPTVTLGAAPAGRGGRCQELALAAAGRLAANGRDGVALLAAGTDGRDGPTDAGGAVVDALSWARAAAAGADPAAALRGHDAYRALDAAGDLLRTGPTGTNVRDLVIGVVSGVVAANAG